MRSAALFDMDHTLVAANSALLYVKWLRGRGEARRRDAARFGWWFMRYMAGAVDASGIARVVARPLAGRDAERFIREVEEWSAAEVVPFISARARSVVAQRQARGDLCAVLTSSTAYAAKPVADFLGIEHVLASRLVAEDGRLTGSIEEPFCFGGAKVTVAERWAREHEVDLKVSAFYSDSITDLPMLDAVGEPVVVNPDPRLRWTAWRRGWPVERW
ncbi:MAG: HAD family hydrolase [Deltaproteobacteria bacterium]|nr:HAD family hydrolase [Deltaproteobacteria bacterium]